MIAFWSALGFVVLAEMGDKTQLLAMAFAARFSWKTVMLGVFCSDSFQPSAGCMGGFMADIFHSYECHFHRRVSVLYPFLGCGRCGGIS